MLRSCLGSWFGLWDWSLADYFEKATLMVILIVWLLRLLQAWNECNYRPFILFIRGRRVHNNCYLGCCCSGPKNHYLPFLKLMTPFNPPLTTQQTTFFFQRIKNSWFKSLFDCDGSSNNSESQIMLTKLSQFESQWLPTY